MGDRQMLTSFLLLVLSLEQGDFKLRVRTLDVERQNERAKIVQKNTYEAVVLSVLFQSAITLATVGSGVVGARPLSRALFGAAIFLAVRVPLGLMKIRKLDKYNEKFGMKA
jgi:hypothetical protein